jgi:hypothetical protein
MGQSISGWSVVIQVFLQLAIRAGNSARFFVESVFEEGEVTGYIYWLIAHRGSVFNGDNVVDEIINHYIIETTEKPMSPKAWAKKFPPGFGTDWKHFYNGVQDWMTFACHVFPDVSYETITEKVASKCFSPKTALEAANLNSRKYLVSDDQVKFPKVENVLSIPTKAVSTLKNMKYPHLMAEEFGLTRIGASTLTGLATRFPSHDPDNNAGSGASPPRRQRTDEGQGVEGPRVNIRREKQAKLDAEEYHEALPLAEFAAHVAAVNGATDKIADNDVRYAFKCVNSRILCKNFHRIITSSRKRSPGDLGMHKFMSGFTDGIPNMSNRWMKRALGKKNAKSLLYYEQLLATLDSIYSVDQCHHAALLMSLFVLDAFRLEFGTLKLGVWLHSKRGGVSKSFLIGLTEMLSVKGIIFRVDRFTPAAFGVDGTAENPDSNNQTNCVIVGDDWSPDLFALDPKDTKAATAMKTMLSEQFAGVVSMFFTDDGKRIQSKIRAPISGNLFVAFNGEIENQPIGRRNHGLPATEEPSGTLADTLLQAWALKLKGPQKAVTSRIQWLQGCAYLFSQMQYAKLLPEFTYGASSFFLMKVIQELVNDQTIPYFNQFDVSTLIRIKHFARVLAMVRIFIGTFCTEDYPDKEITEIDMLSLVPAMFITVEDMANATIMMLEGYLSPLVPAVFELFKRFVEDSVKNCQDFNSIFAYHSGQDGTRSYDYSTLSFGMDEASNWIISEIHTMLPNFTPSKDAVEAILGGMSNAPRITTQTYSPISDLKGKLTKSGEVKLVRPFAVRTWANIPSQTRIRVATAQYDELFYFDHENKFMGLGTHVRQQIDFSRIARDIVRENRKRLATEHDHQEHFCRDCASQFSELAANEVVRQISAALVEVVRVVNRGRSYNPQDSASASASTKAEVSDQTTHFERCRDGIAFELKNSVFWSPALEKNLASPTSDNTTWDLMIRKVALCLGEMPELNKAVVNHFIRKFAIYFKHTLRRADEPVIMWWINESIFNETAPSDGQEGAQHQPENVYNSIAHRVVGDAMQKVMNGKNQAKRTVSGGPHPKVKFKMQKIVIGDDTYSESAAFEVQPKRRLHPEMGEFYTGEVRKAMDGQEDADFKIREDLDVFTMKVHWKANGIRTDYPISEKLIRDIGDEISSRNARWDNLYLHGIKAKNLAPIEVNELDIVAQSIMLKFGREGHAAEAAAAMPPPQAIPADLIGVEADLEVRTSDGEDDFVEAADARLYSSDQEEEQEEEQEQEQEVKNDDFYFPLNRRARRIREFENLENKKVLECLYGIDKLEEWDPLRERILCWVPSQDF